MPKFRVGQYVKQIADQYNQFETFVIMAIDNTPVTPTYTVKYVANPSNPGNVGNKVVTNQGAIDDNYKALTIPPLVTLLPVAPNAGPPLPSLFSPFIPWNGRWYKGA
jgi:hypothetical protein